MSDVPASEPQFGAPPTVTQAPARLGTQGTLDLVKKETRAPEAATVNNGADELAIALNNTDLKSPTLLDTLENTISVYGADTFNGIDVITQRLLNMQELELAPESPQTKASKNLAELRAQINSLDYSAIDGTPGKRGLAKRLLGRGKNKMEAFFYQYATVNRNIEGISKKLKKSTDALVMQQAELVKLRERLQEGMRDLNEKVAVLQQFADMVRAAAEETRLEGDEETARIYTEKVLYVTEQRIRDLLTKLEIAGQAYLTSDVVSSNGKELIRGIRRAEDTTLWAYKMTAYIARSLGMQEAVLQQLGALKQTTRTRSRATPRCSPRRLRVSSRWRPSPQSTRRCWSRRTARCWPLLMRFPPSGRGRWMRSPSQTRCCGSSPPTRCAASNAPTPKRTRSPAAVLPAPLPGTSANELP